MSELLYTPQASVLHMPDGSVRHVPLAPPAPPRVIERRDVGPVPHWTEGLARALVATQAEQVNTATTMDQARVALWERAKRRAAQGARA